jgi:cell division protease FtsH
MMKASYEKAYKLLKKNMPTLDAIAQVLYEKENLSGKEFMELYERYQNVKLTEAEKVQ